MYKNYNYLWIISELLSFLILKNCPETIRDINLQPFSNKRLFGEHPSVLPILLFVVSRHKQFLLTASPKPLGRISPNFTGMILGWST